MNKQREIKFRAWDYKTKLMYTQGVSIHTFRFEKDVPWELVALRGLICDHTDGQIMQFTGLKDKNGKEIYSEDIVKLIIEHQSIENGNSVETEISQVEFTPAYFRLRGSILGAGSLISENLEVIGNIYENKELLK